jgi:hypothetical protein
MKSHVRNVMIYTIIYIYTAYQVASFDASSFYTGCSGMK